MLPRRVYVLSCVRLLLVLVVCAGGSSAQTTSFTYQGKLSDGGGPATGSYDLQFTLWDALSGGTQQGTTQIVTNVAVASGIFTVQIDFGACASCFNGSPRFLEIAVEPTSGSTFTTLAPRQPISSTPYAIKSQNATAADGLSLACVNCVTSTQIASVNGSMVSGPIPVGSVPAGSANYIQNQSAGPQASSNFNISGNGTANILSATTQYNLAGQRILSVSGPFSGGLTAMASNTFLGENAGVNTMPSGTINDPTGKFNTFMGALTGVANTMGANNSFFGGAAGNANTTGSQNSFFGLDAGRFNTTGENNTFSGGFAGFRNTTQHDNTFIGNFSGSSNGMNDTNSLANLNTFAGSQSGQANTTGGSNSFFGAQAGYLNTTGYSNAFFGEEAGYSNTTGMTNSFFGGRAGRANTTGVENAFFGYAAGFLNTTGFFNAFFGEEAGTSNTTGFDNSFVGFQAGLGNSTGGNNTLIGNLAGSSNQTGSNNTMIGSNANLGSNNLQNATAIGAVARVDESNALVLGAINGINNSFADTAVGIGTTTPSNLFGTPARLTLLQRTSGQWTQHIGTNNFTAGNSFGLLIDAGTNSADRPLRIRSQGGASDILSVGGDGKVGIGTSSPIGRLNIVGSAGAVQGVQIDNREIKFRGDSDAHYSIFANRIPGTLTIEETSTNQEMNTPGTVALAISKGSGNVAIGATATPYRFSVVQNTPNTFATHVLTTGLANGSSFGLVVSAGTNSSDISFQSRNQAGTSLFAVRGDGQASLGGSISVGGNINVTGSVVLQNPTGFPGATSVCVTPTGPPYTIVLCSSSYRYKTAVSRFKDGLSVVDRLNPIAFSWKLGGKNDIGFGAEDVEKIDQRLIFYNDKGQVEGVKYDRIAVVLVNAVKEQQAQIEKQQEQLKQQQEQITQQQRQAKQHRAAFAAQQQQIDALKKLLCQGHKGAAACR